MRLCQLSVIACHPPPPLAPLVSDTTAVYELREFDVCDHRSLQVSMVYAGFFPSCPSSASYGYDIDLLDLLLGMQAHSAISVHAMAGALHDHHRRRGHVLRGPRVSRAHAVSCGADPPWRQGEPIQEGYRRTLQRTLQWYEILRSRVERQVVQRIEQSRTALDAEARVEPQPDTVDDPPAPPAPAPLAPGPPSRTVALNGGQEDNNPPPVY